MAARPRRSVLYMPASNAKALAKARALAADAIISTSRIRSPPIKAGGARAAVEAVKAGGFGGARSRASASTARTRPGARDDLEAAIAAAPDAILLPKVDGPGTIMVAARAMNEARRAGAHPHCGR